MELLCTLAPLTCSEPSERLPPGSGPQKVPRKHDPQPLGCAVFPANTGSMSVLPVGAHTVPLAPSCLLPSDQGVHLCPLDGSPGSALQGLVSLGPSY